MSLDWVGATALPYPNVARKLRVITLARNEERDLPQCLSAIPAGIQITVIDSGSTDRTPEIARANGAEIVFHEFTGFHAQRNFALTGAGVTEDWCLFIDADEVYTREFWEWAEAWLAQDLPYDYVYISQLVALNGKILRHAPGYPLWHVRMARTGQDTFVQGDAGPHSESVRTDLRGIHLDIPYIHYWHNGPLKPWMEKHMRLAIEDVHSGNKNGGVVTVRARLNRMMGDNGLKVVARFVHHFILCAGFLDGAAGFTYALMYSWYEFSKWLVRNERREFPRIELPYNVVRRPPPLTDAVAQTPEPALNGKA